LRVSRREPSNEWKPLLGGAVFFWTSGRLPFTLDLGERGCLRWEAWREGRDAVMLKRIRLLAYILVALYLVTWVGGWISHARDVKARAEASYQAYQRKLQDDIAFCQRLGMGVDDEIMKYLLDKRTSLLSKGGPFARVNWCLPILPCLLLSNTDIAIAPGGGGGDNNIVFYYGFGSIVLCSKPTWRA